MNLPPNYADLHPQPTLPGRTSMMPVWITLVGGIVAMWLINFGTNTLWGWFAMFPWLVANTVFSVHDNRKHRRYMRASDEWAIGMHAYYDEQLRRLQAPWN